MAERFLYSYPKEKTRLLAALLYPNDYSIGMSNLGVHAVYHILQTDPRVMCERFFTGGKCLSVESGRSLAHFDAVFVSISFEGDLPNIIRALKASGIEPDNRLRENGPIVIAGGVGAAVLPHYLGRIADAVVCADAGLVLPGIISALIDSSRDRKGFLRAVEGIEGVHPFYSIQSDTLAYAFNPESFGNAQPVHSVILSENTEFSNRGLIQVSQGCLYRCAFCLVGCVYGKYMAHPAGSVIETARLYQGHTEKIGLVAPTLTNHPEFKLIIRELNAMGFRLSFSAFRIEGLDDETLSLIVNNENKTLVIAPETASEAMKKAVRKNIPRETIIAAVRRACEEGIKRIKLYFLVGLPGETDADIRENIELVKSIREASMAGVKEKGFLPEIIVDINPLVPKPLTAFAGAPFEDVKSLKKKILAMKTGTRNLGRVFVYGESPKHAFLQYRMANRLVPWEELLRISETGPGDTGPLVD